MANGSIVIDVLLDAADAIKSTSKVKDAFAGMGKALAGAAAIGVGAIAGIVESTAELNGDLARLKANAESAGFGFDAMKDGMAKVAAVSGEMDSAVETMSNLMATDFSEAQLAESLDYINGAAIKFSDTLKTEGIADGLQETFATGEAIGQFGELLERSGVDLDTFNAGLKQAAKNGTETDYVLQQMASLGLGSVYDEYQKSNPEIMAYNDASTNLQLALADLGKTFTPLVTASKQFLTSIIDLINGNKTLDDVLDGVGGRLANTLSSITGIDASVFIDTFNEIKMVVLDAANTIETYATGAVSKIKEVWASEGAGLVETAKNSLLAVQDVVLPILSGIADTFSNLFNDAKNVWEQDGQAILERLANIFESVKTIVVPIAQEAVELIVNYFGKIKEFWDSNGQQILEAVSNIFQGILAVVDFCMPAVQFVVEYVWTAIKNIFTGALDVIMGAVKIFSGLFTGDWSKMWEGVKQTLSGAVDLILGIMSLSFVGGIRTALVNLGKAGLSIIKGMWDDIAKLFTGASSAITNTASKMATSVVNFFKNIWTQGSNIFGTLRTFGASTFNALKQAVTTTVSGMVTSVVTFVRNLSTNFVNLVTNLKASVVTKFNELKTEVINKVKSIDLMQIGKDIVNGLIGGIGSMFDGVKTKIGELANLIPDWAAKVLGIHSPSRVMKELGKWVGVGLAEGISDTEKQVTKTVEDLGYVLIDVAENTIQQEKEIRKKADADILKARKDAADKIAALEKSSSNKIANIQDAAAKKKTGMTASQQRTIVNGRAEKAAKIIKIEEETAAKVAQINAKATSDSVKLISTNQKEILDEIKLFVEDKKSLEEMSVLEEIAIWDKAAGLFEDGTKEKVEAQKAYAKALDEVNKEVTSVNEKYTKEMSRINDDLNTGIEKETKRYTDAFETRKNALVNFMSIFDEFDIKVEKSGQQLLTNLSGQVEGFKAWQKEIDKLAARAIDDGLLSELKAMGPKALGELQALNSLSETELQKYSELYKEKAALAAEQATKELEPLKAETEKNISDMRKAANTELSKLGSDWASEMRNITAITKTELGSLESIAHDAAAGLKRGLESMKKELSDTATELGKTVETATKESLKVKSPSRVMMGVGEDAVKGLVISLEDEQGNVYDAAHKLGEMVITASETVVVGLKAAGGRIAEQTGSITNAIVGDFKNLGSDIAGAIESGKDNVSNASERLVAAVTKPFEGFGTTLATLPEALKSSLNSTQSVLEKNRGLQVGGDATAKLRIQLLEVASQTSAFSDLERRMFEIFLKGEIENYRTMLENGFKEPVVVDGPDINIKYPSLGVDDVATSSNSTNSSNNSSSQILKTQFDQEKEIISERLRLKQASLTDELAMYEEFIKNYQAGTDEYLYYERSIQNTKQEIYDELVDINEEYSQKILKAQKELTDGIEKLKKQRNSDMEKAQKKHDDALIKAREDFLEKSSNALNDEKAQITELNDAYKDAYDSRKQELYNFAGIFDKVSKKEGVTGKRLMIALQSQVDTFKKWQSNLNNLSKKGIDQNLLAELQAMGPEAATEIAALNSLSSKELNEYSAIWREKSALAASQATKELEPLKQDTARQIDELRTATAAKLSAYEQEYKNTYARIAKDLNDELGKISTASIMATIKMREDTAIQLEMYQQEWQTAISKVKDGTKNEFNAMVEEMPLIGQNVIEGMMQGLANMAPTLMDQVKAIAESMKSTIQSALDIHSPSRWARNFIMGNLAKGFVLGADDNKGMISGAAGKMAEWLKPDLKLNTNIGKNGLYVGRLTPPVSSTTNSTSSHTDQSKHVSATFNFDGSGNAGRDVKRAWREMAFKMGV